MKEKIGSIIVIVVILCLVLFGVFANKSSISRWFKSVQSEAGGGLDRVVTVYDYDGDVICEYKGKIDIEGSSEGKVKFDLDGKRTLIYGGIVIVQED